MTQGKVRYVSKKDRQKNFSVRGPVRATADQALDSGADSCRPVPEVSRRSAGDPVVPERTGGPEMAQRAGTEQRLHLPSCTSRIRVYKLAGFARIAEAFAAAANGRKPQYWRVEFISGSGVPRSFRYADYERACRVSRRVAEFIRSSLESHASGGLDRTPVGEPSG